jgi:predicted permease
MRDLRDALRMLRRSPVFTLTAVVSLAIGIGANATIFSVVSAMLLRPLPGLDRSDRLVDIGRTHDGSGFDNSSYPNYRAVRASATTLAGVYAYDLEPHAMSLAGTAAAERISATTVSGNYFSIVGTRPEAGRLLTDGDDTAGRDAVVVISDELWRRRFGGDLSAVGRPIVLNGDSYLLVGVTPPGFQGTTLIKSDAWLTLSTQARGAADRLTDRKTMWLMMGGRLAPQATLGQATAEIDAIGRTLQKDFPRENEGKGLRAVQQSIFPGRIGVIAAFIGLLMAIVATVLLIACVNLAGMMLARAASRHREIAVRLAIGAGRWRLVRQLLTESLVLCAAGGVAGLLLTRWLIVLLMALLPALPIPVSLGIQTDWRVVIFSTVVVCGAALFSGLAPALSSSRPDVAAALRSSGGTLTSRVRLRSVFLVGQVTLSLALVVMAGLFVHAVARAATIDPGFDQRGVEVVSLDLSLAGLGKPDGLSFARNLLQRIQGLPGVRSAAMATDLPLDGERTGFGTVHVPDAPDRAAPDADWNLVTPALFRTLGITLREGRDFTAADTEASMPVVIVNGVLAEELWPGHDAVGRQVAIETASGTTRATVVGIAGNAHDRELDRATATIYAPIAQHYRSRMNLLIKSDTLGTLAQARALIAQMNPNLPAIFVAPLSDVTAIELVPQRLAASIAGILGMVGLFLAAIGIYGVIAYDVARRIREIGIRMALGADGRSVVALILRHGVVLTSIGVAIGLTLSAAAARVAESFLFGVTPLDPLAFAGGGLLFVVVALVACVGPARRASRVDPMTALRAE